MNWLVTVRHQPVHQIQAFIVASLSDQQTLLRGGVTRMDIHVLVLLLVVEFFFRRRAAKCCLESVLTASAIFAFTASVCCEDFGLPPATPPVRASNQSLWGWKGEMQMSPRVT